ncbi:MAG: DUF2202 domain-containing protein [Verrucomicrobiales bacterium]|nr:DUF2202 domain-containing protein [Verrucomicrobiota bacterium JB025]
MKTITLLALGFLAISSIARGSGAADLIRLYEEEVLAHDLYVALGKVHPEIMPLRNIPRSELMHRKAMAAVLKADGIPLPKPPAGRRFVSAGLDETFATWLAEGIKSEAAACRVGVRLEDHDIADLRKAQLDFPAHKDVFARLEAASNNHLRAFHRNLMARGGAYTPEALPAADLKAILDGTKSRGPAPCGAATRR